MSRISPEEVREIAVLARLALTDEEVTRMTHDLGAILGYVDALKQLDTATTEPMPHAVPFDCPLRADAESQTQTEDEAQTNAPRHEASNNQVPRIVTKGGSGPAEEG